jgi:HKD family nuclease
MQAPERRVAMQNQASFQTFQKLLGSQTDLISRVAASLWSRVGRPTSVDELRWIEPLTGNTGPKLLHEALSATGAITGDRQLLDARGVATFCVLLLGGESKSDADESDVPGLVWTLPGSHAGHTTRGGSYASALIALIESARKELILVSPFIDELGMGRLTSALLGALRRKVEVILLTVNATNIASFTSRAVEVLRREAERAKVNLSVYTADPGVGRDREIQPLIHAKLVIADGAQVLLGSANLTSYALTTNFEAGVLLGTTAAEEARAVVATLLKTRTVHLVFRVVQP